MITRRDWLKSFVVGGTGSLVAWKLGHAQWAAARLLDSATLTKFVDRLPIPPIAGPDRFEHGVLHYTVTMSEVRRQLHSQLPPTTLWGYNGIYPGPTFETRRDHPIAVTWLNDLPSNHRLPIDPTIHGAAPPTPEVRTVVHLHGAKVLPDSDGYPEAWFTNNFVLTGPAFRRQTYQYPNDQAAATLWYHDHALGATRLNVYMGLAGFYLIRDDEERALNLPRRPYDIPLMIQDRLFDADGSLLYPVVDTGGDPDPSVPPIWIPEFFGDTVLVNGRVWPYLEVEPRRYRFRLLNASNARFWRLTLAESDGFGAPTGQAGPAFLQIGSDGGLLPAPVALTELLLAPAERMDVVIDFTDLAGKAFVLRNDAPAPYPGGDPSVPIPTEVMLFKVSKPLRGRDHSAVPPRLVDSPALDPAQAAAERNLVLTEMDSADPYGNPIMGLLGDQHWDDPVSEEPKAGTLEVWNLFNLTGDAHPIHVHLVQFQVLNRQALRTDADGNPLAEVDPQAPVLPPAANERLAWKDTVKTYPGFVTRIIARFELPKGTATTPGERFRYVWHCHILEHEDNEMMRPYDVVA